jgi:hypothetical protein
VTGSNAKERPSYVGIIVISPKARPCSGNPWKATHLEAHGAHLRIHVPRLYPDYLGSATCPALVCLAREFLELHYPVLACLGCSAFAFPALGCPELGVFGRP